MDMNLWKSTPKWMPPRTMNLQLFAEGDDPGASGGNGAGEMQERVSDTQTTTDGVNNPSGGTGDKPKTFTQAELDAAVERRLARERKAADERIEKAREEARSEAEKLAKMTADQRLEHERKREEDTARDREAKIAAREADISRRELRAEAIDTLAQRGLPRELEQILNYADANTCSASIETIEKVFRSAVQAGVDARLKASGVALRSTGGAPDYDRMNDDEYYASKYKKQE